MMEESEPDPQQFQFDFLLDKDEWDTETSETEEDNQNYSEAEDDVDINYPENETEANGKDLMNHLKDGINTYDITMLIIQTIILYMTVVQSGFIISAIYKLNTATGNLDTDFLRTQKFPRQVALWDALETQVNDVRVFKRPATMILLYKRDSEETLDSLLPVISKYAACNITDCSKAPLIVPDKELNLEVSSNYHSIIDKYRNDLKEKGVMIVTNLENVSGAAARIFYNFCDKSSPVVRKSLFIFTMKVPEFPADNQRFFVDHFKIKWSDVKSDYFDALTGRISETIVTIRP